MVQTNPLIRMSLFFILAFLPLASCTGSGKNIVLRPDFIIAGAEDVGHETCALCHAERVRNFKYAEHADFMISLSDHRDIAGCEACHGPGSLHVESGGAVQKIINPAKDPATCFQCHLDIEAQFHFQYHHPVLEGRMNCVDCHSPHGRDIYSPTGVLVTRNNDTCRQCHRDKARPYVFEHEALREGCIECHRPHGSINDKKLVQDDLNLCLKCHGQIAEPGSVVMGDVSHTSRVAEGGCWSAGCHTAVHGSDINPHLRY